jgi:hypothetical protein
MALGDEIATLQKVAFPVSPLRRRAGEPDKLPQFPFHGYGPSQPSQRLLSCNRIVCCELKVAVQ